MVMANKLVHIFVMKLCYTPCWQRDHMCLLSLDVQTTHTQVINISQNFQASIQHCIKASLHGLSFLSLQKKTLTVLNKLQSKTTIVFFPIIQSFLEVPSLSTLVSNQLNNMVWLHCPNSLRQNLQMQILCKFKIPVFLAICSDLGLFIHPRMIMAGDEVRPPRPMDQGCPVRGHVG